MAPDIMQGAISTYKEVYDSPDESTHHHILSPKLGASPLTWHLTDLGIAKIYADFWTTNQEHTLYIIINNKL